jgi:photosystem II stability/assembly factor-like uncharacterized protein
LDEFSVTEQEEVVVDNQFNEAEVQETVYALAASPDYETDKTCFAAKASGMYGSRDGGASWKFLYSSLNLQAPLQTIGAVVSPEFEKDPCVFAGVPGGILRSKDGGETWTLATISNPAPFISALAVSPNFENDCTVFAGTMEDGVFRSVDQGANWVAWNFGLFDRIVYALVVSPNYSRDREVFVGTETGVFKSTSSGRGWRDMDFPMEAAPVLSLAISPDYGQDGTLFAGTESSGLFVSNDRGKHWKAVESLPNLGSINAILLSRGEGGQSDALVLFEQTIFLSRDGGASWTEWNPQIDPEEGLVSVIAPLGLSAGSPVLVGCGDGQIIQKNF